MKKCTLVLLGLLLFCLAGCSLPKTPPAADHLAEDPAFGQPPADEILPDKTIKEIEGLVRLADFMPA